MKKSILIIIITLLAFSLNDLNAQTVRFKDIGGKDKFVLHSSSDNFTNIQLTSGVIEKSLLREKIINESDELLKGRIKKEGNKNFQEKPKEKSTWLAVGLSALLPGAGQFYAKNIWKAAIFLGVEAAAWGTFAYFQHKGNKQTESFQNYANQYWSINTYAQWLNDYFNAGLNPQDPDKERLRRAVNEFEAEKFSHTLPEFYSQQYYEMIGKYQNFQGGWSNLNHIPDNTPSSSYYYEIYKDPIFNYYADERQKANDFYNRGDIGIYAMILNHILSAADAAWTVSIYNKEVRMKTGMGVKTYISPYTLQTGMMPTWKLSVSF